MENNVRRRTVMKEELGRMERKTQDHLEAGGGRWVKRREERSDKEGGEYVVKIVEDLEAEGDESER